MREKILYHASYLVPLSIGAAAGYFFGNYISDFLFDSLNYFGKNDIHLKALATGVAVGHIVGLNVRHFIDKKAKYEL